MKRPPGWVRAVGAVAAPLILYNAIAVQSSRNVMTAAVLCPVFLLGAISPRWLYDDRGDRWARAHPIVSGAVVFAFLGGLITSLLADSFSWRVSLSIGLPAALGLAVAAAYFGQRHPGGLRRRTQGD